jgi:ABC-2 type transport system ATP-binding protein
MSDTQQAMIRTNGLYKSYGKVQALCGLDLNIPYGSVGLLGHNGAGKSTLIRVLLGLLRPNRGSGRVLGHDIATDALAIRQKIGYLPEHDCLITDMESIRFVAYMGMLSGLCYHDAMQRAHEVLYYVGIVDERYRKIETYSTGMKQKVKLAQALVHDPELLFLDEPTNGMDPKGREEMLELIRDLTHVQGKHIVLSSHLLNDVQQVCDEVVLLQQGKMELQTTLREALAGVPDRWRVRVQGLPEVEKQFVTALTGAGFSIEHDKHNYLVRKDGGVGEPERALILQTIDTLHLSLRMLVPDTLDLEDVYLEHAGG